MERVQQRMISSACVLFERFIIIGFAVNGVASVTKWTGKILRYCQTGKIQTYVLAFLVGILWFLQKALQP